MLCINQIKNQSNSLNICLVLIKNLTLILGVYFPDSVEKLKNFLLDIRKEIIDGKLWIALQANTLSDAGNTKGGFEESFKRSKNDLENYFTVPALTKNMRNSENINKTCQGVPVDGAINILVNRMIEKLPPLHSPTTSSSQDKPIFIPIHQNDFDSNLKNILSEVLDQDKKTLILHSGLFKGEDLKSLLVKSFSEIKSENIIYHNTYPNDATKEDLEQFLKRPEIKIGIFQSRFVTGMEGSNVIYFHGADGNLNNSLRCTMTRAVSHLCIIHRFENNFVQTKFLNTEMNKKFIYCQKEFENGENKRKCMTCKTKQICHACLIGCHNEHQIEFGSYAMKKREKCHCIKTKCLIQKKGNEKLDQSKTSKKCTIS